MKKMLSLLVVAAGGFLLYRFLQGNYKKASQSVLKDAVSGGTMLYNNGKDQMIIPVKTGSVFDLISDDWKPTQVELAKSIISDYPPEPIEISNFTLNEDQDELLKMKIEKPEFKNIVDALPVTGKKRITRKPLL